jgi:hypothetical protein
VPMNATLSQRPGVMHQVPARHSGKIVSEKSAWMTDTTNWGAPAKLTLAADLS